ncbi:MAG: GNAT family N-acetyltransferase, partial [Myxococcota bacterium]
MELDAEAIYRVVIDGAERLPDAQFVERPDWIQLRTPSSSQVPHNKILRAVLADEDADATIAGVQAEHQARGAQFAWVVDWRSRPLDLSARLVAAGVSVLGDGIGMVRSADDMVAPEMAAVRIVRVDLKQVRTYAEVMCRAWPRPLAFADVLEPITRRSVEHPGRGITHWLAFVGDEPVGASMLRLMSGGLAYLQGASVMPHVRGRGVYRAMMQKRMAYGAARGHATAVIWANPKTSAPIASRMQFHEVPLARITFH